MLTPNSDKASALVIHISGFFAVIITLLSTTGIHNMNSAHQVFGYINDNTGWNSQAAAFFIGMLPGAYGFLGIDGPTHNSEEVRDPPRDVPRAMAWGVLATALIGLPFVLTLAFCMGDPVILLESPVAALSPLVQVRVPTRLEETNMAYTEIDHPQLDRLSCSCLLPHVTHHYHRHNIVDRWCRCHLSHYHGLRKR